MAADPQEEGGGEKGGESPSTTCSRKGRFSRCGDGGKKLFRKKNLPLKGKATCAFYYFISILGAQGEMPSATSSAEKEKGEKKSLYYSIA